MAAEVLSNRKLHVTGATTATSPHQPLICRVSQQYCNYPVSVRTWRHSRLEAEGCARLGSCPPVHRVKAPAEAGLGWAGSSWRSHQSGAQVQMSLVKEGTWLRLWPAVPPLPHPPSGWVPSCPWQGFCQTASAPAPACPSFSLRSLSLK